MTSTQARYLETMYRALADRTNAQPDMDLPTMRDVFEELHLVALEPEDVTYAEVDAGGVPALWCVPPDAAPGRVMLHCHGGGFMICSMHTDRKMAGHLARATGMRVLVLDYRHAPEFPFPAQLDDVTAAYRWLLDQGVRPDHVISGGHSAGGNLSTTMVLRAREEGLPLPAGIVAVSPWYDMTLTGSTMDTNEPTDPVVRRPLLAQMRAALLGDVPPEHPLANPLHADLTGLPPIMLHVGDQETLVADAVRLADRARAAGVDVELHIAPGMQHSFTLLAGRAPEADTTIAAIGKWARARAGLG